MGRYFEGAQVQFGQPGPAGEGALARLSRDVLYAAWWWLIVALSFVLAWFAVILLPRLAWRWAAVRAIARAALVGIGVPVSVAGRDRNPRGNAMFVFNHSSYMDALVLSAILPGEPVYVVKRELGRQFFAGPFLRRLGALFVERYDVSTSLADAEAIIAAARQGRNISTSHFLALHNSYLQ